jgi:hypothetical protein
MRHLCCRSSSIPCASLLLERMFVKKTQEMRTRNEAVEILNLQFMKFTAMMYVRLLQSFVIIGIEKRMFSNIM